MNVGKKAREVTNLSSAFSIFALPSSSLTAPMILSRSLSRDSRVLIWFLRRTRKFRADCNEEEGVRSATVVEARKGRDGHSRSCFGAVASPWTKASCTPRAWVSTRLPPSKRKKKKVDGSVSSRASCWAKAPSSSFAQKHRRLDSLVPLPPPQRHCS